VKAQLTTETEDDLAEAQRWYSRQRGIALSHDFRDAVGAGLALIESYPEGQQTVYRNVRRLLLRRFPYALFYVIDEDIAIVIGCFHTARDPNVWQERADVSLE
jgi:plasmid stabilization system protein ParE